MLLEYEMLDHIARKEFMPNYLLWHQHGEVLAPIVDESDGSDDKTE
jgi:hypothetical protein